MRIFTVLALGVFVVAVPAAFLCAQPQGQETAPPRKDTPPDESKGMPPRAAPTDYQGQGKAGDITIGAEFTGHSIATPDATYSSEEYIVVEAALFGPAGARLKLSQADFSLRINGKKQPNPAEPYELVFKSLKDPEWEPPVKQDSKSKTSLNSGGGGGGDNTPPPPPKMPIELRRAMEQRVLRAAMLEGDRALPQAGLLFFEYRGKTKNIRSLELVYNGPAGNATIALQP